MAEEKIEEQNKKNNIMHTFASYDYTLCNQNDCDKKDYCKRYLTYQKAMREKYKYTISVYKPKITNTFCDLFVDANKE